MPEPTTPVAKKLFYKRPKLIKQNRKVELMVKGNPAMLDRTWQGTEAVAEALEDMATMVRNLGVAGYRVDFRTGSGQTLDKPHLVVSMTTQKRLPDEVSLEDAVLTLDLPMSIIEALASPMPQAKRNDWTPRILTLAQLTSYTKEMLQRRSELGENGPDLIEAALAKKGLKLSPRLPQRKTRKYAHSKPE